jgi:Type IV secretion system pilin
MISIYMSFIKKLFSFAMLSVLALSALSSFVSAPIAYAQLTPSANKLCGGTNCPVVNPGNVQGGKDGIVGLIISAAQLLTFIFAAVAVLFLVWGGVQYVTSGGDDGRVKNAKNTILYAIIGLVITIVAYAIVGVISNLLTTGATVI